MKNPTKFITNKSLNPIMQQMNRVKSVTAGLTTDWISFVHDGGCLVLTFWTLNHIDHKDMKIGDI